MMFTVLGKIFRRYLCQVIDFNMRTLLFLSSAMLAIASSTEPPSASSCYCLVQELSNLRGPVHIEPIKGSSSYMVGEQIGFIHTYDPDKPKGQNLKVYLDLTEKVVCESKIFEERGLLGFALHPKFNTNKKIYIYTVRKYSNIDHVVVSEITDQDIQQEKLLLVIKQPGEKRNGGQLLFGQDGFLYIFVGDGGPEDDQSSEAQNGESLLGKVLRVDVDQTTVSDYRLRHYGIPASNPVKTGWRPEVFAMGIRHMWRCSVDKGDKNGRGRGRIFCGELGTHANDEIDLLQKGGNYEWPYIAGGTCLNPDKCSSIENATKPIFVFNQSVNAVVGGPLYRGKAFPGIDSQLVYGDFVTADLFTLRQHNITWEPSKFTPCDHQFCSCGARAFQSTYLISFGHTTNDEVMLLMTDDLNPTNPKGSLLSLVPQQSSSKQVTCGAGQFSENTFMIYSLVLTVIFFTINQ